MTDDMKAGPGNDGRRLTGRHVLMIFVGFFAIVFAVNGVFLRAALSTYSGVVSTEPYVKGLHYNDRIEAGERQTELGWAETAEVGLDGRVTASLKDAAGRPVTGLKLIGVIGRPATNRDDRDLALAEAEPGRYVAAAGALEPGTWVLSLAARRADAGTDPVYRSRRRVWLKR